MHYLFAFLFLIHGIIHLLGFIKAFRLAHVSQLTCEISKSAGVIWMMVALGLISSTILYIPMYNLWFVLAFFSTLISQTLIIGTWRDAKFGTIANAIILFIAITHFGEWKTKNIYQKDILELQSSVSHVASEVVTEQDLVPLPEIVQNYLRYVGVVGKPKAINASIELEGEMRQKEGDWFQFNSEQYNFYQVPARLFLMTASIKGLPTIGYHSYKKNKAKMVVKLFSLFPAVRQQGKKLFQAETVTILNDMCLLVPASLIDPRIEWEVLDDYSVKAIFTNSGVTISAVLLFNEQHQLVNFISEDRYAMTSEGLKKYIFSTPIKGYRSISGYNLFSHAEAIWNYTDGEFVYGKFRLKSISINTSKVD